MDAFTLMQALTGSLSANTPERNAAEAALSGLDGAKGYLPCLFAVITSAEVQPAVAQAGSIYLKNLVSKHWSRGNGQQIPGGGERDARGMVVFPEEDKAAVRAGIFEALASSNNQTRGQLVNVLKKIAHYDFPAKMGGLVEQVSGALDAEVQQPERVRAAVLALHALCKNYEFKPTERRAPINEVMGATFPALATIIEKVLAFDQGGNDTLNEIVRLGCKCLWCVIHQDVPPYLQDVGVFTRWMSLTYSVIARPVPSTALAPLDADKGSVAAMPFWAAKRVAAKVMNRLFQSYGNPKTVEMHLIAGQNQENEVALARLFHDTFAVKFLELFLQVLSARTQGMLLPDRLLVEMFNFVTTALSLANTWAVLKPAVMPLVTQVLYPMLCHDAQDQELWSEDPQEFIRRSYDVMEDYSSPRVSALSLVSQLCRKRPKACLEACLEFCNQRFAAYEAGTTDAAGKDGAMYLLGSLGVHFADCKASEGNVSSLVAEMLVQRVAKDLRSEQPHLRGRACWAVGQFSDFIAQDNAFHVDVTSQVLERFGDEALPVRFQAAVALRKLVYDEETRAPVEGVAHIVAPLIVQIMEEIFKLMDQVGSDELVATLDVIIECFPGQVSPYAQGVCVRLADSFVRLAQGCDEDGASEENSSLAASQCCSAIATLLDSIKGQPHVFTSLEEPLVGLLTQVLTVDASGDYAYSEYLEDALDIHTYLTYYSPTISTALWTLFQPLAQSFFDWAVDYLPNINMPLINYISRDTPGFLSVPTRTEVIFRIISKVFEADFSSDSDLVAACQLAQVWVLSCAAHMDKYIPGIILLIVRRLQTRAPKRPRARTAVFKVCAACLLVNSPLVLLTLEAQQATDKLFQLWFHDIVAGEPSTGPSGVPEFTRTYFKHAADKKLCCIGLSAILGVPPESLPASVRNGLGYMVAAILTFLFDLDRLIFNAQNGKDGGETATAATAGQGGGEDDDVSEGNKGSKAKTLQELVEEVEDEEEEDATPIASPIDQIDEVLFFSQVLEQFKTRQPAQAATLLDAALGPDQKACLQAVLASVPIRMSLRVQAQEKAGQEARAAALAAGSPSAASTLMGAGPSAVSALMGAPGVEAEAETAFAS